MYGSIALNLLLCASAIALPQPESTRLETRSAWPFTRMVAFGDNLSDNGNGQNNIGY